MVLNIIQGVHVNVISKSPSFYVKIGQVKYNINTSTLNKFNNTL